jgi:succinoglycan biosynthesis protein ExoA
MCRERNTVRGLNVFFCKRAQAGEEPLKMHAAELETRPEKNISGQRPVSIGTAPEISVVIPCRNESNWVLRVLEDLAQQRVAEKFEVLVADGESEDGTWEILQDFKATSKLPFELVLLRNHRVAIPNALNLLVEHARGKYIVRVDAHSRISKDYLAQITKSLKSGMCDVAGPRIEFIPASGQAVARVIASVCNSRMGNGGTPSRTRLQHPVRVDHTVMSCFARNVWNGIGGYDETLRANEDFDYDFRAAKAGYKVLSLPNPIYSLVARGNLGALIRQRWRYGFWKAQVLKKFPSSLKLRQLLPMLALPFAFCFPMYPMYFAIAATVYILMVAASLDIGLLREQGINPLRWIKIALLSLTVMLLIHFVWSAGVWYGLFCRKKAGDKCNSSVVGDGRAIVAIDRSGTVLQ